MKALLILLLAYITVAKSQFGFRPFQAAQNTAQGVAQAGSNTFTKAQEAAQSAASSVGSLIQPEWKDFASSFNKKYSSPEAEKIGRDNYIANKNKIDLFNQEFSKGVQTFVQGANSVADMVFQEFNKLFNGLNTALRSRINLPPTSTFAPSAKAANPDHVDWRESGAVTPAKSQVACACCWAFAAAGAIEGHDFRKTGKLVELSPQNLMDCSRPQGNEGCSGGLVETVYESVKVQPGVNALDSYPYEAKDGECRYKPEGNVANVTGYVAIPRGDEKALETAVATKGPVAVGIQVLPDFQFYKDGVYYNPKCSGKPEDLNHAVLVIGYGSEPNGQKYWLVKNSYGTDWGIGGYFKLAKDKNNHCGIATYATFPLV